MIDAETDFGTVNSAHMPTTISFKPDDTLTLSSTTQPKITSRLAKDPSYTGAYTETM